MCYKFYCQLNYPPFFVRFPQLTTIVRTAIIEATKIRSCIFILAVRKIIFTVCGFISALFICAFCACKPEGSASDFSALTYIALGDSITEGNDGFSHSGGKVARPYPSVVKDILNLKESVNRGVGGSTVVTGENSFFSMLERYPSMPDGEIISVLGGVNDFGRSVPLGNIDGDTTTFYGALNALADGLKRKYPDAFIFFMTPYRCSGIPSVNRLGNTLEQFAQAVKEVCSRHNLPCLDMYNLGGFEKEMNDPRSDGIHPSQSFYINNTAPQIADFIKENALK